MLPCTYMFVLCPCIWLSGCLRAFVCAVRLACVEENEALTGVSHGLSADQTIGGLHGNGAHLVATQVLGDLEHDANVTVEHLEGVEDAGQVAAGLGVDLELNVDDGANDLGDASVDGQLGALDLSLVNELLAVQVLGGSGGLGGGGLGLQRGGGGLG